MSLHRVGVGLLVREVTAQTYPSGKVGPLVQIVRWIKPRFKPIAKSKQFYVRKPTPVDPEEHKLLMTLNNTYRTQLKAIRHFFVQQQQQSSMKVLKTQLDATEQEEESFKLLLLENQRWNEEVAKVREADLAHQEELHIENLKKKQERNEQRTLERLLTAEEIFQREKEGHFISIDNLDMEIEKVLDSRVDYNFAIDKQGNQYKDEIKKIEETESKTTTKD